MKSIMELNETNFEPEVLKAGGPVLVDFYAPWCGPCKMLAPFLEQPAIEFGGKMKFAKLNVDDALEIAQLYDITGAAIDASLGFGWYKLVGCSLALAR